MTRILCCDGDRMRVARAVKISDKVTALQFIPYAEVVMQTPVSLSEYFVLVQNRTVYVKGGEFFRSQGGTTEDWGKNWKSIYAESIDDARRKTLKAHGIDAPTFYQR